MLFNLNTAGLRKRKDRSNHGLPLTSAIKGGRSLYELRVGSADIARVFFFFQPDRRIVCTHGYVKKAQKLDQGEIDRAGRYRADWERRHPETLRRKRHMDTAIPPQEERDMPEHNGPDDIERYIATFTEEEREGLAAADAAIDIAILLHRVREHRGLNQGAAAKLAGLHQQAVSRFERPGANPHVETVRAYLGALGYRLELNVVDLDTGEVAGSMSLPAAPRRSA